MPHVELPQAAFAQELLAAKRTTYMDLNDSTYFHESIVPALAEEHMVEYLNCGSQKVVFVHPDDSSKVVTAEYWNRTPTEHKQTFYLHNVFNNLWPHNIPHVFAAGKTTGVRPIAWSIRQRILEQEASYENPNIIYPFNLIPTETARYQIPFMYDAYLTNFIVGTDGGEYYVDDLDHYALLPLNAVIDLARAKNLPTIEEARLVANVISFNHLVHASWEEFSIASK